ncbi:cobalt import ATP-binding protein CbiO 1 [Acidiphilium sp. CAG:727]|nr:cobalt import ATP-binding protein CbiO 1 [Acidiphilium sp. CAG:727]
MNAVNIENLSFAYPQREGEPVRKVLCGLSLAIEKGEFVSLIGSNGSGKSTLSRLINGLLQPVEGKVEVFGMNTADKKTLFDIRKRVGTVFQNPDNQQVASIVEDDIAFGPENIGMPREKTGERIDYVLKVTDMEKYRNVEVARLSGGQKQRVAIAGALAIDPEILILDEATSMLDPKGRNEVMSVVKDLNKNHGLTVINITHYMDEAVNSDRIFVLHGGKIAMQGTSAGIFAKKDEIRECGLELPRAASLAEKLRAAGIELDGQILTKEELATKLCESLPKI